MPKMMHKKKLRRNLEASKILNQNYLSEVKIS